MAVLAVYVHPKSQRIFINQQFQAIISTAARVTVHHVPPPPPSDTRSILIEIRELIRESADIERAERRFSPRNLLASSDSDHPCPAQARLFKLVRIKMHLGRKLRSRHLLEEAAQCLSALQAQGDVHVSDEMRVALSSVDKTQTEKIQTAYDRIAIVIGRMRHIERERQRGLAETRGRGSDRV